MKLTCTQMDVLISFYIDGDLSKTLKTQVEEHLKACPTCRTKYDIIKSMITELRCSVREEEGHVYGKIFPNASNQTTSQQFRVFKNNLSAYIDNELDGDENIKIKKYTINNHNARQALEDSYNIRKLMNDSFRKTKTETKQDFSKNVLKQLQLEEEATLGLHPVIKFILGFTLCVIVLTIIILFSLSV